MVFTQDPVVFSLFVVALFAYVTVFVSHILTVFGLLPSADPSAAAANPFATPLTTSPTDASAKGRTAQFHGSWAPSGNTAGAVEIERLEFTSPQRRASFDSMDHGSDPAVVGTGHSTPLVSTPPHQPLTMANLKHHQRALKPSRNVSGASLDRDGVPQHLAEHPAGTPRVGAETYMEPLQLNSNTPPLASPERQGRALDASARDRVPRRSPIPPTPGRKSPGSWIARPFSAMLSHAQSPSIQGHAGAIAGRLSKRQLLASALAFLLLCALGYHSVRSGTAILSLVFTCALIVSFRSSGMSLIAFTFMALLGYAATWSTLFISPPLVLHSSADIKAVLHTTPEVQVESSIVAALVRRSFLSTTNGFVGFVAQRQVKLLPHTKFFKSVTVNPLFPPSSRRCVSSTSPECSNDTAEGSDQLLFQHLPAAQRQLLLELNPSMNTSDGAVVAPADFSPVLLQRCVAAQTNRSLFSQWTSRSAASSNGSTTGSASRDNTTETECEDPAILYADLSCRHCSAARRLLQPSSPLSPRNHASIDGLRTQTPRASHQSPHQSSHQASASTEEAANAALIALRDKRKECVRLSSDGDELLRIAYDGIHLSPMVFEEDADADSLEVLASDPSPADVRGSTGQNTKAKGEEDQQKQENTSDGSEGPTQTEAVEEMAATAEHQGANMSAFARGLSWLPFGKSVDDSPLFDQVTCLRFTPSAPSTSGHHERHQGSNVPKTAAQKLEILGSGVVVEKLALISEDEAPATSSTKRLQHRQRRRPGPDVLVLGTDVELRNVIVECAPKALPVVKSATGLVDNEKKKSDASKQKRQSAFFNCISAVPGTKLKNVLLVVTPPHSASGGGSGGVTGEKGTVQSKSHPVPTTLFIESLVVPQVDTVEGDTAFANATRAAQATVAALNGAVRVVSLESRAAKRSYLSFSFLTSAEPALDESLVETLTPAELVDHLPWWHRLELRLPLLQRAATVVSRVVVRVVVTTAKFLSSHGLDAAKFILSITSDVLSVTHMVAVDVGCGVLDGTDALLSHDVSPAVLKHCYTMRKSVQSAMRSAGPGPEPSPSILEGMKATSSTLQPDGQVDSYHDEVLVSVKHDRPTRVSAIPIRTMTAGVTMLLYAVGFPAIYNGVAWCCAVEYAATDAACCTIKAVLVTMVDLVATFSGPLFFLGLDAVNLIATLAVELLVSAALFLCARAAPILDAVWDAYMAYISLFVRSQFFVGSALLHGVWCTIALSFTAVGSVFVFISAVLQMYHRVTLSTHVAVILLQSSIVAVSVWKDYRRIADKKRAAGGWFIATHTVALSEVFSQDGLGLIQYLVIHASAIAVVIGASFVPLLPVLHPASLSYGLPIASTFGLLQLFGRTTRRDVAVAFVLRSAIAAALQITVGDLVGVFIAELMAPVAILAGIVVVVFGQRYAVPRIATSIEKGSTAQRLKAETEQTDVEHTAEAHAAQEKENASSPDAAAISTTAAAVTSPVDGSAPHAETQAVVAPEGGEATQPPVAA